jgi:hypothetical protein
MPTGSATFTNTNASSQVRIIKIAWIADTSGAVLINSITDIYSGVVVGAFVKRGSPTPANNYRVTVKDQHGTDVLNGLGANGLSNTVDHQFTPNELGGGVAFADSNLELNISSAGSQAQGEVYLYLI